MAQAQGPLLLKDVHIIDTVTAQHSAHYDVLIRGGRIDALDPTGHMNIPNNATIVDLSGRILMPGLWDMHVNGLFLGLMEWQHPLMLAHGVTGMADFGSDPAILAEVRQQAARPTSLTPAFVTPGPMLDGTPPANPIATLPLTDPASVPQVLNQLADAGVDFFHVQSMVNSEVLGAVLEHAKTLGKRVTVQGPLSVGWAQASDMGVHAIETVTGLIEACTSDAESRQRALYEAAKNRTVTEGLNVNPPALFAAANEPARMLFPDPPSTNLEAYSRDAAEALAQKLAANGTYVSPQILLTEDLALVKDLADDPRMVYVPPAVREMWSAPLPFGPVPFEEVTPERTALGERYLAVVKEVIGIMYEAGVPILAGTHSVLPYVFPGFDLHRELALLVEAGLSPLDAIRAASLSGARSLGLDADYGSVEVGKVADLLILDENPLEDIQHTRSVHMVIKNGRPLEKDMLDGILEQVKAQAT